MSNETTVFIVDDDQAARESVRALVEAMGLTAELFVSAREFLDAYDRSQPGCLVTDLCMLGMTGVELQETLINMGIRIPTIVISGFADVPVTVEAMKRGALTLLEKPCSGTELCDAIRKAIAQDIQNRAAQSRRAEIAKRFDSLTKEEREILDLVVAGTPNKVIATKLDIGLRTVESRRHRIFRKMQAGSLAELIQLTMEVQGDSSTLQPASSSDDRMLP